MFKPPVFQSATFTEAKERAQAKGIWLIVAVTSPSSAPCEMMDKISWRDQRVVAWIEEKALAVQFDLDADGELMRALDVGAAPTLIGFRAGEEKDRVVGFRDGVGLLLWLGSLERGKTDLHRGRGVGADLDQDMRGRLSFAKALLYDQNYIDATVHYAWLWNNMTHVNPDMSGVRVSYMAGERSNRSWVPIHRHVGASPRFAMRVAQPRPRTQGRTDHGATGSCSTSSSATRTER